MPTRRRALWLLAAAALAACSRGSKLSLRPVAPGATVLALGDSITFGTGAAAQSSYPAVLARLTGWEVVNAGVPGDTTAGALARVEALLAEHKPELVLVSIGGNDFLRRLGETESKANIRRICRHCLDGGAQVLLIAVPRPTLGGAAVGALSDHGMYAELAQELKVPLHAKGWSAVLADARLRSDQIHANAQGYEQFARGLAETAKAVGLLG